MKGKLVLLTVLMMLALVITGCKQTDKQSSETATTETTATEKTEEAASAGETTDAAQPTLTAAPTVAAEDTTASTVEYKDGIYEVQTEPDYEKYYTKATVTIEGGKITAVDWCIYDANQDDKPFDEEYYHVFESVSDVYVQQAKDDWTGSRGYSDALITSQNVEQVDAVSGATWTNKKFKEIVKLALEKAKN